MAVTLPLAMFAQSGAKHIAKPMTKKAIVAPSMLKAPSKAPNAYCVPTGLECTDGDIITNVTIGTINNPSTCGANGYSDFTATSTGITPGAATPLSVTVGDGWFERVSVWVDLNNNEIFEASELMTNNQGPLGTSGNTGDMGLGGGTDQGGVLTGNISLPADTAPGSYRMRVMLSATGSGEPAPSDPCLDDTYGEVEDYTVVVAAPPVTGCLTAVEGQYPAATFTPTCNGTNANITTAGWLNEYSKVNVIAGTPYTFSTSVNTFFITISDNDGTTVLASGTGSVTYTPTISGVVRFYAHLSSNCDGASTLHTRRVSCGTPPPPPASCEDFKVLSNNLENGGFLGGDTAQRLAVDISVGDTGFNVYGMEPTMVGPATTFTFKFYSNNAGLPGTELATRTGTIVGSTVTGNNFGYDFYKYTVAFDTPMALTANTVYWVEVISDADGWESSAVNRQGLPDVFANTSTSQAWAAGTTDYVYNLICNNLAVSDSANSKFSVYPNPVKDYLNISSTAKVSTVSVFNMAGQNVATKMINNQIDMSKLAPGVYIVNATLANGSKQSFKVVKK